MRPRVTAAGRYGQLKVLEMTLREGKGDTYRKCLCDCGKTAIILGTNLRNGLRTHCPARHHQRVVKTHGMSNTPTYVAWFAAKTRCTNPNQPQWKDYGGRGITMCDRWLNSFENFLEDMGEKPSKELSIDRIDGSKGYEPGNCRWADTKTQNRNSR